MLPLVLPPGPRRPELISFSCAIGVLLGVGVMLLSLLVGRGLALVPATASVLAVSASGFTRPRLMAGPYRLWNRFGRRVARIAERWTLGVCYFVIFPIVGRAGSSFRGGKLEPGDSAWIRRESLSSDSFASLSAASDGPRSDDGWIRGIPRWAGSSPNLWAIALIPFLILMRSFSYERDEVRLDTNYTLY